MRPSKVLVLYGPRRVGKTTLLEKCLSGTPLKYRYATGDDLPTQRILSSLDVELIREYLEGYELFALDEAQFVPQVGRALKIIVDQIPGIREIAGSYLLRDILAFDRVKGSQKVWDLLKLLAFQVGADVSLSEIAAFLRLNIRTVQHYLDLLEKSFVLYRLGGFSRNLRKEITKKSKYLFFDNGIRNAVIAQFNPLEQRDDAGQFWENFMVMERTKYLTYRSEVANLYFWRTYSQQELDLVEERGRQLDGYEFKWSLRKAVKPPPEWVRTYPKASFTVVTPDTYQEFVLPAK